jgi:hypothetical protein
MRTYNDTNLTPYQRDKTILELRQRGYTYKAIGKVVGMDPSGVMRAFKRLAAGGPGTRPPCL